MGFLDAVEGIGEAVANVGKGVGVAFGELGAVKNVMPLIGRLDEALRPANSPILEGGQVIIAGMRRTTGTGEPDRGDQFGRGSQRFRDAAGVLATAGPTDDWAGSGADAYDAANHRQRGRTMTMSDLDHGVHTVVAGEAFQIGYHRGKLDDQSNWLADVGRTTFALGLIPGIGPAMKAAAETQAVIAAVGSSSMELASLSDEVSANAAAVQRLVGQYQAVADSTSVGLTAPPPPPPPEGSGEEPPEGEGDESPPPGPSEDDASAPSGDDGSSAPSSGGGGGGGTPSGGGGGAPVGDPEPSTVPHMTAPPLPQAPVAGGGPGAASGVPAAPGPLPAAMGAAPAGAGVGGATSALGPLIQAAVQRAFELKNAEEVEQKAREEEEKKRTEEEQDTEHPAKDEDGNGIPDTEEGIGAEAAPGAVDGGRAPIHVEFDVDPNRLETPMTVTLDRDRPIVVPPTATT